MRKTPARVRIGNSYSDPRFVFRSGWFSRCVADCGLGGYKLPPEGGTTNFDGQVLSLTGVLLKARMTLTLQRFHRGDVAELADAKVSKTFKGNLVWVRFPPSPPEVASRQLSVVSRYALH